MDELKEKAFEYLNDKAESKEAEYVDVKMNEMKEEKMKTKLNETIFASTEEAIQYLANCTGKKIIIGADEENNRKFLKRGPQDGTGPRGNTSDCSIAEITEKDNRRFMKKGPQDGTGPRGNTSDCSIAKTTEEDSNEEGQEIYLRETMIDDTHKLVLEDEKDGKYEVEIYEITDSGQTVLKEFNFTRLEEAQAKYDELLPKEEDEFKEEPEEAEGEVKMSEDLVFASSNEALQHLADLTGKKIMVAGNKSTFPCPNCGTKVLENTKYCVKCKKKVEKE